MSAMNLPTRKAVLALLKASPGVTALMPAARIYPQAPPALPAKPFIRWGAPTAIPIRGACLAGAEVTFALHGFASSKPDVSAEDHAGQIEAAIVKAVDGRRVTVAGVGVLKLRVSSSLLLTDDEADTFHAVVNVRGRFLAG